MVVITGQGKGMIALSGAFLAANVFFIGLRVYTKARISKNFNINDMGMMIVVVGGMLSAAVLVSRNFESRSLTRFSYSS